MMTFKYKEDVYLKEAFDYIKKTYGEHYQANKEDSDVQFMDLIMADPDGLGFLKYNASKYPLRYGKKDGYNKKDLLKTIHYCLLLLYKTELIESKENSESENQ